MPDLHKSQNFIRNIPQKLPSLPERNRLSNRRDISQPNDREMEELQQPGQPGNPRQDWKLANQQRVRFLGQHDCPIQPVGPISPGRTLHNGKMIHHLS
jgi:hypothetical protein